MVQNRLSPLLGIIAFFLSLFSVESLGDEQQLLLLLEYVSVDYADAVQEGIVVDVAEYEEMREFSAQIGLMAADLEDNGLKSTLVDTAGSLKKAVQGKRSSGTVRSLTGKMINALIDGYGVLKIPPRQPEFDRARDLYRVECASCHGEDGAGNGILSQNLDPPAIDFTDMDRYRERTLSGLYNTISLGVTGTSMAGFSQLSEHDRWSLAFYVGAFAMPEVTNLETSYIDSVKTLITTTPAAAFTRWGEAGAREIAWLRRSPSKFYNLKSAPLDYADKMLGAARLAYRAGDTKEAYRLSLVAYLEGFELVEPALQAVDARFANQLEIQMSRIRSQLQSGAAIIEVEKTITELQSRLHEAEQLLRESQLSPLTAFTSAVVILLREGIEAMLVVLALITFLVRTDRRDGVFYIHFGWVGALLAGAVTWWISNSLVSISGASREVTEGVAALAASVILLYVGFWMHSKANADNWQKFIEAEARKALSSGALWGLSLLAFIAVYREVFETILFYQALWTQTAGLAKQGVAYGFGIGVVLLVALGILISRFSKNLPIRQFFLVSGLLMFALAFILAGKGVGALQEAGLIDSHAIAFVDIGVLGIHPNLESVAIQVFILVIGAGYWLRVRSS